METIKFKRKMYELLETMHEGEFHKTFLVSFKNKMFVLKQFVDQGSFLVELKLAKEIDKIGIRTPKILKKDKKTFSFLQEYIEGKNMLEEIAEHEIDDHTMELMFTLYRFARFSHVDLNYYPELYKVHKDEMYYLSYDMFNQNENINFENYGIKFWMYGDECIEHLKEKGFEIDKTRRIPSAELKKKIVLLSIMKW